MWHAAWKRHKEQNKTANCLVYGPQEIIADRVTITTGILSRFTALCICNMSQFTHSRVLIDAPDLLLVFMTQRSIVDLILIYFMTKKKKFIYSVDEQKLDYMQLHLTATPLPPKESWDSHIQLQVQGCGLMSLLWFLSSSEEQSDEL